MNIIFRQNASYKEKIFTVLVVISMLAAVYSMRIANAIPNEFISRWWLPISFVVSLCYFIPFFKDRHPSNKLWTFKFSKKVLSYLFVYLLIFFMSYLLVVSFIPDMTTRLFGKPYEFTVIVESKHRGGKGCRHWIKPVNINYGFTSSVCIDHSLWDELKNGDSVTIAGSKSFLGINVEQVVASKPRERTE